eukprot:m.99729 g.99729  ORF g.99729 m.99729 type:complete len:436 (+) comp27182_c0_seq2:267-1574(+)
MANTRCHTIFGVLFAIVSITLGEKKETCSREPWSYEDECHDGTLLIGPPKWESQYPKCESARLGDQSPIDVPSCGSWSNATVDTNFATTTVEWKNTGHVLQAFFQEQKGSMKTTVPSWPPQQSDQSRPRTEQVYKLAQFHLHWRKNFDDKGSDHSIDGKFFPLETHFVMYHNRYNTFSDALEAGKKDALSVLAVFYELSDTDHAGLEQMIQTLNKSSTNSKLFRDDVALDSRTVDPCTFLPSKSCGKLPKFTHYSGGLTTPPCNGATVQWILATDYASFSRRQLEFLQNHIYSNCEEERFEELVSTMGNSRPVQCRGSRDIWLAEEGTSQQTLATKPCIRRRCRTSSSSTSPSPTTDPLEEETLDEDDSETLDCALPVLIEKSDRVMIAGLAALCTWVMITIFICIRSKMKTRKQPRVQFSNPGFQSGDIEVASP